MVEIQCCHSHQSRAVNQLFLAVVAIIVKVNFASFSTVPGTAEKISDKIRAGKCLVQPAQLLQSRRPRSSMFQKGLENSAIFDGVVCPGIFYFGIFQFAFWNQFSPPLPDSQNRDYVQVVLLASQVGDIHVVVIDVVIVIVVVPVVVVVVVDVVDGRDDGVDNWQRIKTAELGTTKPSSTTLEYVPHL